MKIEPGTIVRLRLFGGQIVDARIQKQFLFMRPVTWHVKESWDGSPPFSYYDKARWKPKWRMW